MERILTVDTRHVYDNCTTPKKKTIRNDQTVIWARNVPLGMSSSRHFVDTKRSHLSRGGQTKLSVWCLFSPGL